MRGMFPCSVSEAELRGDSRVEEARQCFNRAVTTEDANSLSGTQDGNGWRGRKPNSIN